MSMAVSGPEASPLRSRPSQHSLEVLDTTEAATGASGRRAAPENLPHGWRGLSLARFNGTVFGILALTLFIYVTVVFCVILPWLSWSVPGVLNLALLTLSTGTALACFLACVMVDPGRCASSLQATPLNVLCLSNRPSLGTIRSAPPLHAKHEMHWVSLRVVMHPTPAARALWWIVPHVGHTHYCGYWPGHALVWLQGSPRLPAGSGGACRDASQAEGAPRMPASSLPAQDMFSGDCGCIWGRLYSSRDHDRASRPVQAVPGLT